MVARGPQQGAATGNRDLNQEACQPGQVGSCSAPMPPDLGQGSQRVFGSDSGRLGVWRTECIALPAGSEPESRRGGQDSQQPIMI
jgi:hypothetical protein